MPAVTEGVEGDRTRGTWYFTATLAREPGQPDHGGTGADAKFGPGTRSPPGRTRRSKMSRRFDYVAGVRLLVTVRIVSLAMPPGMTFTTAVLLPGLHDTRLAAGIVLHPVMA